MILPRWFNTQLSLFLFTRFKVSSSAYQLFSFSLCCIPQIPLSWALLCFQPSFVPLSAGVCTLVLFARRIKKNISKKQTLSGSFKAARHCLVAAGLFVFSSDQHLCPSQTVNTEIVALFSGVRRHHQTGLRSHFSL